MTSELTVYPDVEQHSDEWFELRRGIVTASTIGSLITVAAPDPITLACPTCLAEAGSPCVSLSRKQPTAIKVPHGERAALAYAADPVFTPADNDTSRALTLTLVAERITGWSDPSYVSADMMRGTWCEPIAREHYAANYAPVVEVGFMRRDGDGWTLGCSPDGLVGEQGLIEIKSPRAKKHVRTILADEIPAEHVPQLQAALLVSGREWIDFVSFYGGLPLFVKRMTPDPAWFAVIKTTCRAFEWRAVAMRNDYDAAVTGLPMTQRVDYDLEITV